MITVDILRRDCVVVVCEPTILERLLLRRTTERIVTQFPDIGGSYVWLYENGRPVPRDVLKAIDAAFVEAEWARIKAKWGAR